MTVVMLVAASPLIWDAIRNPGTGSSLKARYLYGLSSIHAAVGFESRASSLEMQAWFVDERIIYFQSEDRDHMEDIMGACSDVMLANEAKMGWARTHAPKSTQVWELFCQQQDVEVYQGAILSAGGIILTQKQYQDAHLDP